jgi:anhydro-N-acetylmuramic acid kinase
MVLNSLAEQRGLDFDEGGALAKSGKVDPVLLQSLNQSWYYTKKYPKTLGGGFVTKVMQPMFRNNRSSIEDKLRTMCEHIAFQIARDLNLLNEEHQLGLSKQMYMLVTGGGAFNQFLIERISELVPLQLTIPDAQTVNFKEALLTALMGVLRLRNEANCFSSVTGATHSCIGGAVYNGSRA